MKARPTGGGLAVAASTILVATVAACAAADGQPPSHCDDLTPPPGATLQPSRDLYCLYLTPRHGLDYMAGHLELRTPHTPFGIAVNAAGNHLYEGVLTLSGLPDPGALGDFEHFVAWIASPHFDTVASLGPVANGTRSIGEIGINKFMILVTAEARPDAPEWEGRLLLRASSPSATDVPARHAGVHAGGTADRPNGACRRPRPLDPRLAPPHDDARAHHVPRPDGAESARGDALPARHRCRAGPIRPPPRPPPRRPRARRRRRDRPRGRPGPAPHTVARLRHVRLQRPVSGTAAPRSGGGDDHSELHQLDPVADHHPLARPPARQRVGRRARRDPGARRARRDLPVHYPLQGPGAVLVPPAPPRGHPQGPRPLREHAGRAARARLLRPRRPRGVPHAGRLPAGGGRADALRDGAHDACVHGALREPLPGQRGAGLRAGGDRRRGRAAVSDERVEHTHLQPVVRRGGGGRARMLRWARRGKTPDSRMLRWAPRRRARRRRRAAPASR